MADEKKSNYEPMPEVPEELRERYRTMLEVISGALSVSEGARRLGLSRNHFQTVMHRGLASMIAGLSPKPPGRPPTPAKEAELSVENQRLRRENEHLQERVDTIDRLLGVASDMLRGQVKATGKRERKASPSTKKSSHDPEDPEPRRLRGALEMHQMGLTKQLAAAVVGRGASTLRRWCARAARGDALVRRRGPGPATPLDAGATSAVVDLVRTLRGLVGADSIRRSIPGVSRRQAAAIKRATVTAMERERIAAAERVVVTTPGIVRGFDAMYAACTSAMMYLLVSSDASVPYRTSIEVVERYDGASVAAALERDIAENGAPLVWREDRARAHDVDEVHEVLRAHGVLPLHGPPHHPRYYGQLERQNREHRAWLATLGMPDPEQLRRECRLMTAALNGLWRRRTLTWKTAAEAWHARSPVQEDRTMLRDEVHERAARIRHTLRGTGAPNGTAERFAIEHALRTRGYLRQEVGGWC
jgi:transposase